MFFNNKFILASTSSSRYKILKNNKLSFSVQPPKCNENILKKKLLKNKIQIKKIPLKLARLKAKSISCLNNNVLVVGSDTIINFEGKILNKAKNLKDVKKKLINISGKSHNIFSSISVYYNNKEVWSTTQKSEITIRKLTKYDIEQYLLKTGKSILTSVGCYQAELLGPNIIEHIKGDFFNVMGFPLFPFLTFLKKYKVKKK